MKKQVNAVNIKTFLVCLIFVLFLSSALAYSGEKQAEIEQTIDYVFENCLQEDGGFGRLKGEGSNPGVTFQALVSFSSLKKLENRKINDYLESRELVNYLEEKLPRLLQEENYGTVLGLATFLNIEPEFYGVDSLEEVKKIARKGMENTDVWDEVSALKILTFFKEKDPEAKELTRQLADSLVASRDKDGLWGYSTAYSSTDPDMTALAISAIAHSRELPIGSPVMTNAYSKMIEEYYIEGSGIKSPSVADSPPNTVTTTVFLEAGYRLNQGRLDYSDEVVKNSIAFVETMRTENGGYRLDKSKSASDCYTTIFVLPTISFEAYGIPQPFDLEHNVFTVRVVDVEKKSVEENKFTGIEQAQQFVQNFASNNPNYTLMKNYKEVDLEEVSFKAFDSIIFHNDKKGSKPVAISYTRASVGSLFSKDSGKANTGENLSFEIIPLTEESLSETVVIYSNGIELGQTPSQSFKESFANPGSFEIFADSEEILTVNSVDLEIIEFPSFTVDLRIEGKDKTIFEGQAEVSPVSINVEGYAEESYIENSIMTPIVNALKNEGIPFTIKDDRGFIFGSINGIERETGKGWYFLRNHTEIEECPSQQAIEPGDGIILYRGIANSRPLALYSEGIELDHQAIQPSTITITASSPEMNVGRTQIFVDNQLMGETAPNGEFEIDLAPGTHSVKAIREGFISSKEYTINVSEIESFGLLIAVIAIIAGALFYYVYHQRHS